ncbi:MAG: hypothetical protein GX902_02435 [Lentisphaerae bacterium]|nr:hypothetical protein [Lentisphaerota bacterium]
MRFRQVHLDFHTSPDISGIGSAFDCKEWQRTLQEAAVDSITCFSCCHHGWSYHPTSVGRQHPHLDFDLLRAQIDASHEIGIKVPVYITAGVNNMVAEEHPEWRQIDYQGQYSGWNVSPLKPGFRKLCFNTPYLDYLCRLIEETVTLFPDADGIFTDIIFQGPCCCRYCLDGMLQEGRDPEDPAQRLAYARSVLLKYYRRATAAARSRDPKMRIYHNTGLIPGDREVLQYYSHLELESLPTGGWGYDHFPLGAAYRRKSGLEFLGMTGKFHTSWGEFGGIKHPNALRYECSAMLAYGAKCSIGDQLHPNGRLDPSTYAVIGQAYREVAQKEPWCRQATNLADIGVLQAVACKPGCEQSTAADIGVSRLLLEEHLLFDMLDEQMDFSAYKLLLLPDNITATPALTEKIQDYLRGGGRLLLSGRSGLQADGKAFAWNFDPGYSGQSPYCPDYLQAAPEFAPDFAHTPFVMYAPSQRIQPHSGQILGEVYDPYFNRSYRHFCSHKHTPNRPEPSGFAAGVLTGSILYFAHPVFSLYRYYGQVALRHFVSRALRQFLGSDLRVQTSLPSQGRLTLTQQAQEQRYVLHLLYANTVLRGGQSQNPDGSSHGCANLEVIEELNPLPDVAVTLRLGQAIRRVVLVPQGGELPHTCGQDGEISFTLPRLQCHQMLALEY